MAMPEVTSVLQHGLGDLKCEVTPFYVFFLPFGPHCCRSGFLEREIQGPGYCALAVGDQPE